jgi:D-alanyl-lipoteichoic acid acyltransferase DltB (MBOAT superfamily)
MIFNSLAFVAFFVGSLAAYWGAPRRWQNLVLLAASYVFYGWVHPWWLLLILATTIVDYFAAREMTARPAWRRACLWLAVAANVGLLGFYKYSDFFVDNVAAAAGLFGWAIPRPALQVALPVGISFYTFQAMGYVIDVYWRRAPARTRFVDVAAFVAFFPNLLAGPIMRATNLLPQFEQERRFSPPAARDAALLIVWGLFKKLVIADNVGIFANKVFALKAPEFYLLWAGVFAFTVQIYADFSAYTDIARGVARWFGFGLIRNFDHPYLAVGPSDFWRRWNISVSTWFRDYLFLPIAYRLSDRIRTERILLLDAATWAYAGGMLTTMFVAGLWHGASWNYVLWGVYHGVLLVTTHIGRQIWRPSRRLRRWLTPFQIAGMFLLTCLGWLIFRETELAQLVQHLRLSPSAATGLGRQAAAYLFLLTLLYSLPLWIQDAWAALKGPDLVAAMDEPETGVGWTRTLTQALLCGGLFTAILLLRSLAPLDFIYFAF